MENGEWRAACTILLLQLSILHARSPFSILNFPLSKNSFLFFLLYNFNRAFVRKNEETTIINLTL